MSARFLRRGWVALAGMTFLAIGIATGVPFDTLYKVGCAGVCFLFVAKIRLDYPTERWTQIAFWLVPLVNICLLFTPIFNRPSSRGEVILFALPDAIILLIARLVTTSASDDHERAQRQMVILGLVVAVVFCTIIYSLFLLPKAH